MLFQVVLPLCFPHLFYIYILLRKDSTIAEGKMEEKIVLASLSPSCLLSHPLQRHLLSRNTHSCLWHCTFPMPSPLGPALNQEQKADIKNSVWKTSITYVSVILLDSLFPEQPWAYSRVSKTPKRPSWRQTKDAPCPAQLVKPSVCFGPSEISRAQVWKHGAFYCSCWGKGRASRAETRINADVAPDSA